MTYIVCGWYTPDYAHWVPPLLASLDAVRAPHDFTQVDQMAGGWERNTLRKPRMLAEAMGRHPGTTVILMDVDALVKRPLDELAGITTDVGVHLRGKLSKLGNLRFGSRSGTMVVRPTAKAQAFVALWAQLSEAAPWGTVDQRTLTVAIARTAGLTVTNLSVRFCATEADKVVEPVIAHGRASRDVSKVSWLMRSGRALVTRS